MASSAFQDMVFRVTHMVLAVLAHVVMLLVTDGFVPKALVSHSIAVRTAVFLLVVIGTYEIHHQAPHGEHTAAAAHVGPYYGQHVEGSSDGGRDSRAGLTPVMLEQTQQQQRQGDAARTRSVAMASHACGSLAGCGVAIALLARSLSDPPASSGSITSSCYHHPFYASLTLATVSGIAFFFACGVQAMRHFVRGNTVRMHKLMLFVFVVVLGVFGFVVTETVDLMMRDSNPLVLLCAASTLGTALVLPRHMASPSRILECLTKALLGVTTSLGALAAVHLVGRAC